jgi:hypothetical protein
VQWTATASHAGETRDPSRVLEQGPDRQRTPRRCSGGVSSIVWSLPDAMGSPSDGSPDPATAATTIETPIHQPRRVFIKNLIGSLAGLRRRSESAERSEMLSGRPLPSPGRVFHSLTPGFSPDLRPPIEPPACPFAPGRWKTVLPLDGSLCAAPATPRSLPAPEEPLPSQRSRVGARLEG